MCRVHTAYGNEKINKYTLYDALQRLESAAAWELASNGGVVVGNLLCQPAPQAMPLGSGSRRCPWMQAPGAALTLGHTGMFLSGTDMEVVVTPRQALVEPRSPRQRGIPESGRIPRGQRQMGCIHRIIES